MAKTAKKEKNLFEKAKDNAAATPSEEKKGKVVQLPKLRILAAIKTVMDTLKALQTAVDGEVKAAMLDAFVRQGMETKHQPASFDAVDGSARANCQLKKRSSASKLQAEEVQVLTAAGVSTMETVKQSETYMINPDYTNNQELLEKISKKLSQIKDLPADFIVLQPKVAYQSTTENSIEEVFSRVTDAEKAKELLQIVATMAISAKMDDAKEAAALVIDILQKE